MLIEWAFLWISKEAHFYLFTKQLNKNTIYKYHVVLQYLLVRYLLRTVIRTSFYKDVFFASNHLKKLLE